MTLESLLTSKLRIKNVYIRQWMAEFLGMFLLVGIGVGCNAQSRLSSSKAGDFNTVYFGWSVALIMGVFASGTVSGGHLNPAVTLAMAVIGKLSWKKLPVYWLAQYVGAFVASACVYGIYHEALYEFDGGNRSVIGPTATAGIWGTYPQPFLSIWSGLGDQVFGTMLLLLGIMMITDSKNNQNASYVAIPVCVGLILLVIGMSFGFNAGYAINPARDLSPRIFTAMAGWGGEVFSAYDYYFWVPIVGPHIGGVCGVFIYLLLIGIHLPDAEAEVDDPKSVTLKGLSYAQSSEERKQEM